MKRISLSWRPLLFFFVFTFAAAGLGTLLGQPLSTAQWRLPPLAPPAWLFPIAWTILYALMAYAAYLISVNHDTDSQSALRTYLLQVVVNALWPLFFFRLQWLLFSFLWLLFLLFLVAVTALRFRRISRTAGWLLLPYLLWLVFAGYLNFGIYLLNR